MILLKYQSTIYGFHGKPSIASTTVVATYGTAEQEASIIMPYVDPYKQRYRDRNNRNEDAGAWGPPPGAMTQEGASLLLGFSTTVKDEERRQFNKRTGPDPAFRNVGALITGVDDVLYDGLLPTTPVDVDIADEEEAQRKNPPKATEEEVAEEEEETKDEEEAEFEFDFQQAEEEEAVV